MDLNPFVGKKVLLQFKPNTAYAVVTRLEGGLAPLLMKGPDNTAQPVIVPYIDGTIEKEPGAPGYPDAFFLVYGDQARRGAKLRVAVSPDLIGFVTTFGEEPTASVLIKP